MTYTSLPPLLQLLLAPLLGAAFVLFLPVIGFVLVGRALLERVHGSVNTPRRVNAGPKIS